MKRSQLRRLLSLAERQFYAAMAESDRLSMAYLDRAAEASFRREAGLKWRMAYLRSRLSA